MDPIVDAQGQNQMEEDEQRAQREKFVREFTKFISSYTPPKPGEKAYEYIRQLKKQHRIEAKRPGTPIQFEQFLFLHHKFYIEVREREPDRKTPELFIQEDDGIASDEERAVTPQPTFGERDAVQASLQASSTASSELASMAQTEKEPLSRSSLPVTSLKNIEYSKKGYAKPLRPQNHQVVGEAKKGREEDAEAREEEMVQEEEAVDAEVAPRRLRQRHVVDAGRQEDVEARGEPDSVQHRQRCPLVPDYQAKNEEERDEEEKEQDEQVEEELATRRQQPVRHSKLQKTQAMKVKEEEERGTASRQLRKRQNQDVEKRARTKRGPHVQKEEKEEEEEDENEDEEPPRGAVYERIRAALAEPIPGNVKPEEVAEKLQSFLAKKKIPQSRFAKQIWNRSHSRVSEFFSDPKTMKATTQSFGITVNFLGMKDSDQVALMRMDGEEAHELLQVEQKKTPVVFTEEAKKVMRKYFERCPIPTEDQLQSLEGKLNFGREEIRRWFKRQRAIKKKQ